jgi:thioredoxin 1
MSDTVTEQSFEVDVLQSDKAVLVDFWAEWCGPCHAIAPVLDQIAAERSDLKIVKLNIDEEPSVAQRYGVMSIPTLILFKGGEPAAAAVGAMPKSMLEERLGLTEAAA